MEVVVCRWCMVVVVVVVVVVAVVYDCVCGVLEVV